MSEDEAEEIKKRKMQEHQKKQADAERKEKIKAALRQVLDADAYERLVTVGFSNEELFMMTAQQVLAAYNQVKRKITDEELLYVLKAIKQKTEHETKITFKGK